MCLLSSCGEDKNTSEEIRPGTYEVSGRAETFVTGSTLSLRVLDAGWQASGKQYAVTVSDNLGSFLLLPRSMKLLMWN